MWTEHAAAVGLVTAFGKSRSGQLRLVNRWNVRGLRTVLASLGNRYDWPNF